MVGTIGIARRYREIKIMEIKMERNFSSDYYTIS
jgi:hypothetical protein